jgi:hypothetical protein
MQISLYITGIRLAFGINMRHQVFIEIDLPLALQPRQMHRPVKITPHGLRILPEPMLGTQKAPQNRSLLVVTQIPLAVETKDKSGSQKERDQKRNYSHTGRFDQMY